MRTREKILEDAADSRMNLQSVLRQGYLIIELLCDIRDDQVKRNNVNVVVVSNEGLRESVTKDIAESIAKSLREEVKQCH